VFSAGGRNCIGQHLALIETKIILAHLLNSYEFIVDPSVQVKWSFTKFLYTFDPESVVQVRELGRNK
jgi:cytochrome P450